MESFKDNENTAYYNYDASGERNLKLTGGTVDVTQNGYTMNVPVFDQQTLYASALVTINDKGYTKHYFEEGKRICSKIGSGGLQDINTLVDQMELNFEEQFEKQKDGVTKTYEECMNITPHMKNENLYENIIKKYGQQQPVNPDEPVFYYHSDHLGSASYITDDNGNETQHLVYLPFGEDWVDLKYNTQQYDTPYKFNGKEKDPETGYNYYGARYLNTDLSIWLSVDPMSDKYPHLTSYNYCANNPVMLIDPDGKEMWEPQITSGGKVSYVAEKGDNKGTFQSQYGLNAKQTDGIFKGAGIDNRQIAEGTKISGDAVENVTGSDILKLDIKSKQTTPQRFVYQAMFGVLHNKVSGGDFYTDMNNYIKLEGSTGANNCRAYEGNLKIPLLDGNKMAITKFSSSFSKEYSTIHPDGLFIHNFDGVSSRQNYSRHNGAITQIPKMQIIMPNSAADNFTKTYK